jgi:hypothetical protein
MPGSKSGDTVAVIRGLLATCSVSAFRADMSSINIRPLLEALCGEVERLHGLDGELDDIRECDKCDLCEDHHQ